MNGLCNKSVLIIDDDAAMLRALNKVLTGEGAITTNAAWAGEAIERLTNKFERFDLIITDLRMPLIGGRTILGAVAVALPHVPVIIITAFATPEIKAECLRAGAAAFLEKPLDTQQLLATIELAFTPPEPKAARRSRSRGGAKTADASADDNETGVLGHSGGAGHGSDS
jgi:DNA-binding NtrC family response regulator